jgi:ubiquinone/menaquinone biosynthesis C-methylase UbiE
MFSDACSSLTCRVVQDLNKNQVLPHEDEAFDAVLISLGIQYLEKPQKVS